MAQYQPSAILGQLKGSIGSTTFQGGNGSSVIRNKYYRKGSSSAAKSSATSLLTSVTTSWRLLSDADRLAWAAAALLYPFTDKFGVTYFGTAYQCFCSYNLNLLYIGSAIVNTPNVPASAILTGPYVVEPCDKTKILFTPTTILETSQFILIYASNGVSPGRNNNNAKFRLIKSMDMNALASLDIIDEYTNIFGEPKTGQKIIFKTVQVLRTYPFQYYPETISAPVT